MISELPFFELLIIVMLPMTIGMIIALKVIKMFIALYQKKKTSSTEALLEIGDFILFLVFFIVIMNIIYYMTGNVPDDFSIFEYLIEEALPFTWYSILLYGILINLYLFLRGG